MIGLMGEQQQQQQQQQHLYSDSNHTVVSTVHIRVTPLDDYFVSWYILWSCFVVTSLIASWQVYIEYRGLPKVGYGLSTTTAPSDLLGVHNGDPANTVSMAEVTRCMFRRFLLIAMLARAALMPVQIWSDPMWWQFFGDTLPEILFASAWTLLVTFFVQLQGILTGTLTDPTPGVVIQAMTYIVYLGLIGMDVYNSLASILLYTLLCGIYTTLLCILLAFGPRWLWQLPLPKGLAARLAVCNIIACLVFGLHAFSYGRLVVAPPKRVFWWYRYGVLELMPAACFLCLMQPTPQKRRANTGQIGGGGEPEPNVVSDVEPASKPSVGGRTKRRQETIPLVKKSASYGTSIGGS